MIEWKDPPPDKLPNRGPAHARHVADELRRHPGAWAILTRSSRTNGYGVAFRIRSGIAGHWQPAGAFEARYVLDADDPMTGTVYVRYVGGHDTT